MNARTSKKQGEGRSWRRLIGNLFRHSRCQMILRGHAGYVTSVALTPDARAVSGSWDDTLRVWDISNGNCERVMKGHTKWVESVAVTSDGRAVSGSWDCTVRVWDISTGLCQMVLKGHEDTVKAVAVTPDGRIISGSGGGAPDHAVRTLMTVLRSSGAIRESPGPPKKDDHTIRVWDPSSGTCQMVLEGHTGGVWALAATQEGRVVSGS
jgi:predicted NACHT family NTPase